MSSLEKDLCGAIIGWRVGGPVGTIVGVIICHALFSDED